MKINLDSISERMDGLQEMIAAEQKKAERQGKWNKAALLKDGGNL